MEKKRNTEIKQIVEFMILVVISMIIVGCDPNVIDNGNQSTDSNNESIDTSFMPDGMDYETYQQGVDANAPVLDTLFDCDVSDETCLSSKTNPTEKYFGQDVVVTVPKGAMINGLDLTPKVTKNSIEDDVLIELEFPHSEFDGFVEVKFAWPRDANPEDYIITSDSLDEDYYQEVYVEDGFAYLYTNHFSYWFFTKKNPDFKDMAKKEIIIDFRKDYGTGNTIHLENIEFKIQNGTQVLYRGRVDSTGKAKIKLPEVFVDGINNDDLSNTPDVIISAYNGMIRVHDKNEKIYTSVAILKFVNGQYEAVFDLSDDNKRTGFKILEQADKVKQFWLKNYKKNSAFLYTPLNVYYPYKDGTYFGTTKSIIYSNVYMGIKTGDTKSFVMGDGDGDTFAHEYFHYVTWYLYGWSRWGQLVTTNAHHAPGSFVPQPGDAFKEDLSYFFESVFDGKKLGDLDAADMSFKTDKIYETWEKVKTKYASITDKAEKQEYLEKAKKMYNTQNEFLKQMNKDVEKLDGVGGNVLYDMYEQNGEQEYLRMMNVILIHKPISLQQFADKYESMFGKDKFKDLNATMAKYGYRDYEELDRFWEATCMSSYDCDDGNPCTDDWCIDEEPTTNSLSAGLDLGPTHCTADVPCNKPKCVHKTLLKNYYAQEGDEDYGVYEKIYTPTILPEECKKYENDPSVEYCQVLCYDYGKSYKTIILPTKRAEIEESTECFGLGNGEPCVSRLPNEGVNEFCYEDADCHDEYYGVYLFHAKAGYDEFKCVDNFCVYVNVLPKNAKTSCTTNQYDYTTCTYTVPVE